MELQEKLFWAGEYAQLGDIQEIRSIPIQIARVAQTKTTTDALLLLKRKKHLLREEDLIFCRFFIGISKVRESDYASGRALFTDNYKLAVQKKIIDQRTLFFVYQGLGFFRFFCGRFSQAQKWAHRARRAADEAGFDWGLGLAQDLLGHSQSKAGNLHLAIQSFGRAQKHFVRIQNRALADATQVSQVITEVYSGFKHRDPILTLEKLRRSSRIQEAYTLSPIYLELARQWTLRGHLDKAENALIEVEQPIFTSRNRRQIATYFLRKAQIQRCRSQKLEALSSIEQGLLQLDPTVDLMNRLELLTLKQALSGSTVTPDLDLEIRKLRQWTGSKYPENPEDRLREIFKGRSGRTLHDLEWIRKVVELKFFGLLGGLLPDEQHFYCLDLIPGYLIWVSRGQIEVSKPLSRITRALVIALGQGLSQPAELIRAVWGYENYHPLQHDPILYTAMSRARRTTFSNAIGHSGVGYYLAAPLHRLRAHVPNVKVGDLQQEIPAHLNRRQHEILAELQSLRLNSVQTSWVEKRFGIPRITASRDLRGLVESGLVLKRGQARSTFYFLNKPSIG